RAVLRIASPGMTHVDAPRRRLYRFASVQSVRTPTGRHTGSPRSAHHEEAAVTAAFVVDTTTLPRAKVGGVDDPAVRWAGAFAAYGGHRPRPTSTTRLHH